MIQPAHTFLIDIDGLRRDVWQKAIEQKQLPHLAQLFGGADFDRALHVASTAPAPSITFCSQACLFTGAHPREHAVPGNQFFDRFAPQQSPRHYAFDVGDTLAVDDAIMVFTHGLAGERLKASTIYERLAAQGRTSWVVGNMYGRGATTWLKPSLANLGRFIKGYGSFLGMSSAEYDGYMVDRLLDHMEKNPLPDLITLYLMGVDHDSHIYGTEAQLKALTVVDALIGRVWEAMLPKARGSILVALFSDHGQIEVIPDDAHSLKIGFPFEREMGHFFDALGLDVHDYPGESPACDAVMALNGGMASVYLHHKTGHWWDKPLFERDILPIGRAFWEAHETGKYAADLRGALAGVLLRDVEQNGWEAPFVALTPAGERVNLETWFASQPHGRYLDPVNRIHNATNRYSGDIWLISNYAEGYYFGNELTGMHGGLHPEDSQATLSYGWHGVSNAEWSEACDTIQAAIAARCARENGRLPSVVDMLTGIEAIYSA